MEKITKNTNRIKRHRRIRSRIFGSAKIPRLCIFRSSNHIYAQLVNDEKNKTIISADDLKIKAPKTTGKPEDIKTRKALIAFEVGKLIAEKAIAEKIEKVIFDRGGYQYHGRIKALADGAREGGLKF